MATVVSIMDEPSFSARTDVVVVVSPATERLTWVPRDLWCESVGDRINVAFKRGGHTRLAEALAEHGLYVEHGLCLTRAATAGLISGLDVLMPVERELNFHLPITPDTWVEDGFRLVRFSPPVEHLRGDRIHDWIAARMGPDPAVRGDLRRIRRQQQLVAVLLGDHADLTPALAAAEEVDLTSPSAIEELRRVHARWRFETFGPLKRAMRDGADVFIRPSTPQ